MASSSSSSGFSSSSWKRTGAQIATQQKLIVLEGQPIGRARGLGRVDFLMDLMHFLLSRTEARRFDGLSLAHGFTVLFCWKSGGKYARRTSTAIAAFAAHVEMQVVAMGGCYSPG